jgi:hypothetical protein
VAVWVRISGLPIEYYDSRVLKNIGNKIGSTVKVDKNTVMQERGKYARLCVEVDLTKPLLAMFMIKGRKYNVEYEGLHLLCKTCGRFGHYSEGCKEKTVAETVHQEDGRTAGGHKAGSDFTSKSLDGPWMVVQKQKRNKRVKDKENMVPATMEGGRGKGPTNINAAGNINGSRYAALMTEPAKELQTNNVTNAEVNEPIVEGHVANMRENISGVNELFNGTMIGHHGNGAKRGNNESIIIGNKVIELDFATKERNDVLSGPARESNQEKSNKIARLGARVTGSFKGKLVSKNNGKATVDFGVEKSNMENNNLAGNYKGKFNQEREKWEKGRKLNGPQKELAGLHYQEVGLSMDLSMNGEPNVPRPPDLLNAPPFISNPPNYNTEDTNIDKENFLDASDQVGNESSDSDMEVVKETPLGVL